MSGRKGKVHLGPNVSSSAPPTTMGAWSMAVVLWQQYEYYYYYCEQINARLCIALRIRAPLRNTPHALPRYCEASLRVKVVLCMWFTNVPFLAYCVYNSVVNYFSKVILIGALLG